MKKIFYSIIISLIFLITIFLIYLSTAGFETNKFNEFLEKKVIDLTIILKQILIE